MFHPDNPFMRFVSRIADLVVLNILFVLCCIPVITAGAAAAALQKACQVILCDGEDTAAKVFFRAFRENFRQATVSWLVVLVFLVGTVLDYVLIGSCFSGTAALLMNAAVTALLVLVLGIASHLFPLMVRYENTLAGHVKNAVLLAVLKLPRTLAMVVVNLLPVLVAVFFPETFLSIGAFWIFLGFAVCAYLCAVLMRGVFRELEEEDESGLRE